MKLNHLIIHQVYRTKDGDPIVFHPRKTENPVNPNSQEFVSDLSQLFSGLSFGEFGVNGNSEFEPLFERELLKHYISDTFNSFTDFTISLAEIFKDVISEKDKSKVKGGFLAFFQYMYNGDQFLTIAQLNKTKSTDVDEYSLDLKSGTQIDLSKLYLGARINLTRWVNKETNRYISFKAGQASDVRKYFEEFIGCQKDSKAAQNDTYQLKRAIKEHSKSNLNLTAEETQSKLHSAVHFMREKDNKGDEVILTELSKHVFPESDEQFVRLANSEQYGVNEQVAISRSELNKYQRIQGKSKKISISFESELLGSVVKHIIKDGNMQLIISDVPANLREAIEQEVLDRNTVTQLSNPSEERTPIQRAGASARAELSDA